MPRSTTSIVRLLLLMVAALAFGCDRAETAAEQPPLAPVPEQAMLTEARAQFTYKGEPIHPGIVHDLHNSIADHERSMTVGIDIAAAQGSNRYAQPIERSGRQVIYRPELSDRSTGHFAYEWLGTIEDDVQVLRTADWAGGSGTFVDLVFARLELGHGYDGQGERYQRLVLSPLRIVGLGDRHDGEVLLEGDVVVIGPSSRHNQTPVRIGLRSALPAY